MEPGTFNDLNEGEAPRLALSEDQSTKLKSVLIALLFDDKRGGFLGLTSLFQQKGLCNIPRSRIGNGQNQSISAQQVESVFGASLLAAIAEKMEIDKSLTSVAISNLLPALMDEFTVGANDPAGIGDTLKPGVLSAQDWLGELGAFECGASAKGAHGVGDAADATTRQATKSDSGRMLPLLLLCVALAGTFLSFKN